MVLPLWFLLYSSKTHRNQNCDKSVVDYLRSQIVTGELESCQKLNENHIASQLDISRHPIREAFRILENEYLVVSIPRKGSYVSDLSIEVLEELYQAREMIEMCVIDILKVKNIKNLPKAFSSLEYSSRLSLPSVENKEER